MTEKEPEGPAPLVLSKAEQELVSRVRAEIEEDNRLVARLKPIFGRSNPWMSGRSVIKGLGMTQREWSDFDSGKYLEYDGLGKYRIEAVWLD
jgi:hypothetical protein